MRRREPNSLRLTEMRLASSCSSMGDSLFLDFRTISTNTLALISQQARQDFNRRSKHLTGLHRRPELVDRTPRAGVRAYQHARLYAKSGGGNWGIKREIEKHVMYTRHQ